VDVLQAIHLLLAFPLFVVVVGVDPRWLLHSLQKRYPALRGTAAGVDLVDGDEPAEWVPTPQNYLEKIFQIPFALHPMSGTGFSRLIRSLLPARPAAPAAPARVAAPEVAAPEVAATAVAAAEGAARAEPGGPGAAESARAKTGAADQAKSGTPGASATASESDDREDEDLAREQVLIPESELAFMEKLGGLISSPRAAKRFTNTYRLLRASLSEREYELFAEGADGRGEYPAAQLLLAVLSGHSSAAPRLFERILESDPAMPWSKALDAFGHGSRATPPEPGDSDASAELRLAQALEVLQRQQPFDFLLEAFQRWAPRVARYSFHVGRGLPTPPEAGPSERNVAS